MLGTKQCCCSIVFVIIFIITDVNSKTLPNQSIGSLSNLLGKNSRSPLIVIVRSHGHIKIRGTSSTRHRNSETNNNNKAIESPHQQLNMNPKLNQLRELVKLLGRLKNPLRQGCVDSCEDNPPDLCPSDECNQSSDSECEPDLCGVKIKKKEKGFGEKTAREVYEYLKRNPPKRVEPPKKKKKVLYDQCEGSTKGPEWKCGESKSNCDYNGKC